MRHLIIILSILVLSACGGGGGGGSSTPTEVVEVPEATPTPVAPPAPEPVDLGFEYGTAPADLSAARVLQHLGVHASGGPWDVGTDFEFSDPPGIGIARFENAPTVHIVEGANASQRYAVEFAVDTINLSLPPGLHLSMGNDVPEPSAYEDVPEGKIYVHYTTIDSFFAGFAVLNEAEDDGGNLLRMNSGVAVIDRPDANAFTVVVHELLHVLGFRGHLPHEDFPNKDDFTLSLINTAALRALYERFDAYEAPGDLTVANLGSWEDVEISLSARALVSTYGVIRQNGLNIPWVDTPWTGSMTSRTPLGDNPTFTGTVTWSGGILGISNANASVAGDAAISVDTTTLTGTAAFTSLQSWPAGQEPVSAGTTWGDGDLRYTIALTENYFRNNGGDDGQLMGAFVGNQIWGVPYGEAVGTLIRNDLTAAFGATRNP